MNVLYIALKHVIWRFQTFAKYLNFVKPIFAQIFTKFKYFAKQFILTESPDHAL